jgi:hypothetical protein
MSLTVAIENEFNFCLMMPPRPGANVGDTEHESISLCTNTRLGPPLPPDFITAAHYFSTPEYVQVTGFMNSSLYQMDPNDLGGQIDDASWGIRPTSKCAGHAAYLEYIGPKYNIFCIRCCLNATLCDASFDTIGCEAGIKGRYEKGTFSNQVQGGPLVYTTPTTPTKGKENERNSAYPTTCSTFSLAVLLLLTMNLF